MIGPPGYLIVGPGGATIHSGWGKEVPQYEHINAGQSEHEGRLTMSRSQAHRLNRREERAVQDATRAWADGQPHEAIMILVAAGMRERVPAFVRTCHREAVNRRRRVLRHRYE